MRVSIIIASYGGPEWQKLSKRAFKSANRQGALEVIAYHERDGRLAQVRNAAAAGATGDWLCFLDADDELAPGYLRWMQQEVSTQIVAPALLGEIEAGSINEILVPSVQYVRDDVPSRTIEIPNGAGTRPLLEINHIVIGALVPRWLFREVGGFSARWAFLEDYEFWCRCVEHGARIIHVPDAVYRAHVNTSRRPRYTTHESFREHRQIRQQYHHVPALRNPSAAHSAPCECGRSWCGTTRGGICGDGLAG